ncbi:hypothetical protein CLOM_g19019 [Closterium sp. NIES-68]|nr:hypothetical protein CLOM_g19019 [Closterium sp. NIES-68]GJP65903.1 hypothetical protein CLOP_g22804 [Closterium sp. NIES-67]
MGGGGTPGEGGLSVEQLVTLETNIDDSTPQILAYVSELLLSAGALDVWMVNAIMKKGRPGVVLHVLCDRSQCDNMLSIILNETTTLGVRIVPCERVAVARLEESALTPWGWVPVKAGYLQGKLVTATAEYEPCAAIARENHVPLKDVKFAAEKWFIENEAREQGQLGLG